MAFLLGAAIAAPAGAAADSALAVSQSDWAVELARSTGLARNLPATVVSERLMAILSSKSYRRIEAEDYRSATPNMTVSASREFGEFSQKGWLQAREETGRLTFVFDLPARRRYLISARVRGGSQVWKVAKSKDQVIVPSDTFSWVTVGEFTLAAGQHAIAVSIPEEGGLDLIELISAGAPPIEPSGGYQPDRELTYGDKAVTLIRAMNAESLLPLGEDSRVWQAEAFSDSRGPLEIREDRDHGTPSQKKWIFANAGEAAATYYISVARDGLYTLRGRFWGEGDNILSLEIDRNRVLFLPQSKDTFGWTTIDTVPLERGEHRIDVELKPKTGADAFQILPHRNEPSDYLLLLAEQGFDEMPLALSSGAEEGRRYHSWLKGEAEKADTVAGFCAMSSGDSQGAFSGQSWVSPLSGKVSCRFEFDVEDRTVEGKGADASDDENNAWRTFEGEQAVKTAGIKTVSDSADYGDPSAGKWLSATAAEAVVRFEVEFPDFGEQTGNSPEGRVVYQGEAERSASFGEHTVSTDSRPGSPSGGEWLRAVSAVTCRFELIVDREGAFSLHSRDFGRDPFSWKVDPEGDLFLFQRSSRPEKDDRFAWRRVAALYLLKGRHVIEVTVPAGGGFDALEIREGEFCSEGIFALWSRDFGLAPVAWTIDPGEAPLSRLRVSPPRTDAFRRHTVATLALTPGRHIVEVSLPRGSGLDSWGLIRKGWCDEELFSLYSRDFGAEPIIFRIDPEDRPPALTQKIFPPEEKEFSWHEVATLYLEPGRHVLMVELDEGGGFDAWEFRKRMQCRCDLEGMCAVPVTWEPARRNAERLGDWLEPERPAPPERPVTQETGASSILDPVNDDDISPVSPFKP
jgi:hypothetical protein